ncbi:MAG: serine/threonine-protein kinase, partial [Planctomycetota bacterium]|nr:serine/threonine-protein kinase [Planctomycetota bacterium]
MKLPNFQNSRFQIQRELGRGGMGAVYLALDQELGRQVAIKILDTALTPQDYERFRREAMAVAQMQHPYIIQIYDIGHDSNGYPYFVMEFVEGKELKDLIKTNALELPALLDLFKKVTQAVSHAHSKGILHRDLKPQNILIRNTNGDPCLLDFGLARIDNKNGNESMTLTAEGSVMGTLAYMSPEQADGVQANMQSDIWGLGATFYHILTGESPFPHSSSPYKTITSIFNLNPPVPSKVNDELPASIDECLLHCLEKEADDRYQSAEELLEVLESINLEDESGVSPYLIPSLLLVLAAIIVVVFAVYLSLPNDSTRSPATKNSERELTARDEVVDSKTTAVEVRDTVKKFDPPIV